MARQTILMTLEYDGAAYHGWQRQPGMTTVQGAVEEAIATVLRTPLDVVGQGRTDAGVHAEAQTAHMVLPDGTDLADLGRRLNGLLAPACAIKELRPVPEGFHARFLAIERRYRYRVVRERSPLRRNTHWEVPEPLDAAAMMPVLEACRGDHDFGAFCTHSQEYRHTRCVVRHFTLEEDRDVLTFRIHADRFLHNLVRRLVGEAVRIGRGRGTPEAFFEQLDTPGPSRTGITAPPHGLTLTAVLYPAGSMGE